MISYNHYDNTQTSTFKLKTRGPENPSDDEAISCQHIHDPRGRMTLSAERVAAGASRPNGQQRPCQPYDEYHDISNAVFSTFIQEYLSMSSLNCP